MKYYWVLMLVAFIALLCLKPRKPETFDDSSAPKAWLTIERKGEHVKRIIIEVDE